MSSIRGEGKIATLTPWIAGKKGLPITLHGKILRRTEKAVLFERVEGPMVWLPLSQITLSDGPIRVPIGDRPRRVPVRDPIPRMEREPVHRGPKPWIIDEIEGHTNRVVKVHRFRTEEEAMNAWKSHRAASRFAGVGGKFRHSYSYPRKEGGET